MTLSLTAENEALKAKCNNLYDALSEADGLLSLLRTDVDNKLMMCVQSRHLSMVNVDDTQNKIKSALNATPSQCLAIHDAKIIEEFRGRYEHVGYMDSPKVCAITLNMIKGLDSKRTSGEFPYNLWPTKIYTLPIEKE
jgi:hypothetical protein